MMIVKVVLRLVSNAVTDKTLKGVFIVNATSDWDGTEPKLARKTGSFTHVPVWNH